MSIDLDEFKDDKKQISDVKYLVQAQLQLAAFRGTLLKKCVVCFNEIPKMSINITCKYVFCHVRVLAF